MKKIPHVFALISAFFLFNTCEVALGPLVNVDFPVINNLPKGVQPGEYLSGTSNIVNLEIIQAFGIEYVFMTIWYTDYSGIERQRVVPVQYDEKNKTYYVDIDTTGMTDGTIKAQVTAVDVDGKSTTTTDILYIVKNNPPQVEVSLPSIKGEEFDEANMNSSLEDIYMGGDIMGMASDVMGLQAGYPQILFWPADYQGETDGLGIPLPSDKKWGQWRTVTDEKYAVLTRDNLKSVQFRWPLVELEENPDGSWTLPDIANSSSIMELQTGKYRFKIRVKDKIGVVNTYPNRVDNIYDFSVTDERLNHYMEINVISPSGPIVRFQNVPQYYNGTKDFEATMIVTSTNHVDYVRVGVSNNENTSSLQWEDAEHVTGNLYKVTIPFDKMPDTVGAALGSKTGDKVLHVAARDESGLTNDSRSFILDDILPGIEFLEPSGMGSDNPPRVTSTVVVRGINSDNTRVARLYYALGRSEVSDVNLDLEEESMDMEESIPYPGRGWIDTLLHTDEPVFSHRGMGNIRLAWSGNQYSWTLRFEDITDVVLSPTKAFDHNGNYYVEDIDWQENLWKLPIYLKAVDAAGNVKIYKESITVDPNADIPYVEIRSHDNESEQTVGGSVRVSGSAIDNEMIYAVEVRIYSQRDEDCDTEAYPSSPVTNGFVPVNIVGGMGSTVSWYYNVNQDGELNPPGGKETRAIVMEFRAADASAYQPNVFKRYGFITTLTLKISNAVPVVENINIIRGTPSQEGSAEIDPYIFGSKVSGFVTLKAAVRAQEGIESIYVNLQGSSSYVKLGENISQSSPYMTSPVPVEDGYYQSDIYIPINTRTVLYGSYENSAGSYEVALQITDAKATPYMAHRTLTLNIDNYYPMALYNSYLNATGSSFSISGRAWDIADNISIQGVEMVVVYFSRDDEGVSLKEKDDVTAEWVDNQTVKKNRRGSTSSVTAEGTAVKLPFFPDVRKADGTYETSDSGIVIKDSGDTGGYFATFTGNPVKDWSVSFDTNKLNDGPVTLNYVVFDNIGNASHYSQDIYIANNRPLITSISLGTDIQADGRTQYSSYDVINQGEMTTNFRVRNDLFGVNVETLFGNGVKYYKIYYTAKTSPVNANTIKRGNVYTIADPGNIEWINYGVFERPQGGSYTGVTFVSTSDYSGSGDGAVYSYVHSGNANTIRTGALDGNYAQDVLFKSASFGNEPLISESVFEEDGNGNPVLNRNRYFVIKVYDSTVTDGDEREQLSQAIVINADVNNTDIIKPKMSISPFFWNNASNNSLYQNSKDNGHIELESDLNEVVFNQPSGLRDRDPKVSGIVSFRGTAFDDNTIGSLHFKIDGFTDNGAQAGSGGAAGYYKAAAFEYGQLRGIDRFDSGGWKLTITSFTHNLNGHTVQWQLDFNSARVAGVAALDTMMIVIAADRTPNYSDTGDKVTTNDSPAPRYRFDIVPYISTIETNLSILGGLSANYIRTADGLYTIMQGNTGNFVTVRGFNLNPSGVRILNSSANTAYRNNPSSVPPGANVAYNNASSSGNRAYTNFTMTNDLKSSGYLTVIVNSIATLNNINNNDAAGSYIKGTALIDEIQMPNRRADQHITKNLRLTDDVYLQIYAVKKTDVENGYYPIMLIENSGGQDIPVFGYNNDTGGLPGIASLGPNKNAGWLNPQDAKAQRTKFNIESAERLDTEFLIKSQKRTEYMAMARDDSGRYLHAVNYDQDYFHLIYDRFAELHGANSSKNWNYGDNINWGTAYVVGSWSYFLGRHSSQINTNALPLEYSMYNTSRNLPNRYQNPKIIVKGNSVTSYANYYMSYFDAVTNYIIFRNFRIGTQNAIGSNADTLAQSNIDHHTTTSANSVDSLGRSYSAYINLITATWYSGGTSMTGDTRRFDVANTGSNSFDMVVDSTGRAVIAYFRIQPANGINYGLSLYYSNNALDGAYITTIPFTRISINGSNYISVPEIGTHISMAIDSKDRLHLAAFDTSDSDLVYILVEGYRSAAPVVTTVKVDQFDSVGYWTDIKLHPISGRPYIAYYNLGKVGSREAVKIAWPNSDIFDITGASSVKPGVDEDGYTTGDWEYRTIPSVDPTQGADPRFQKVNLQFRRNGDPVIGYLANNIEFSYPVSE